MYTYACNVLETLNQKISLNVTLKLSKVNHSSKNLGMFQLVSTYDIAWKIGHMCSLYNCEISWNSETGNMAITCVICMKVIF